MNFFQAIFLGLVQALTEYLPVSSSAHVRIVGDLMLGGDPGAAFTAIIQIGTELAVLLYFRRDIWNILKSWCLCLAGKEGKDRASRFGAHNKDARLGWYIIIATIPILIAGVLFQHAIETTLRNLWITVAMLFIFGVILWIVDDRARQVKTLDDMNTKDAIWFGIGQMLALPGWGATIAATVVAFVVGYIVIIGFLKFVSTYSYKAFAIYRIALAIIVAILLLCGVLSPLEGIPVSGNA